MRPSSIPDLCHATFVMSPRTSPTVCLWQGFMVLHPRLALPVTALFSAGQAVQLLPALYPLATPAV